MQVMLHILNNGLSTDTWRPSRALDAAARFLENDKNVRPEDRTTLRGYVNELVRVGLVLAGSTGLTKNVQNSLVALLPLVNTRQYVGTWSTLTDFIFELAPTTTDVFCLLTELLKTVTSGTDTFQGPLADSATPFTTRILDTVTASVTWTAPFNTTFETTSETTTPTTTTDVYTRSNATHALRHFFEVFEIVVRRTPRERQHAISTVTGLLRTNSEQPWAVPLSDILTDILVSQRKTVDITDPAITSFLRFKNDLYMGRQ